MDLARYYGRGVVVTHDRDFAKAADRVIVTCEELVDASVTLSDPNRILLPETKVAAVVHAPGGAHPSPVQGHFKRDHAFYRDYAERSRSQEGFEAWLDEWVLDVRDRAAYLHRIDVESLRIRSHRLSVPADFADE